MAYERAGGSLLYPRPCWPERMRAADQFTPTRRGEPRSGPVESRNGQQENHIRSPPNQAVTNPDVAECIRYSDLWCDSFDWRERFVWLRGDGRRNERKASRFLRVHHKFEFRFIDFFLVFFFRFIDFFLVLSTSFSSILYNFQDRTMIQNRYYYSSNYE